MKYLKNVKDSIYTILLVFLLILIGFVTYWSIFNIYESLEELNPFIIILGTIIMLLLFINLKKLISNIKEKGCNYIALIICLIFFIFLFIFGLNFKTIASSDLANVLEEVKLMNENGGKFVEMDYFSMYSHQIPLAEFIYYINHIFNIFNLDIGVFMIFINTLSISVTAYFSYLSVKKLKNYKLALITLLFFVLNPVFYVYSSFYYTDILNMPFITIALYIFISKSNEENIKRKIIYELIAGVLFAIGFKIRMAVIVLLIAVIIMKFLTKQINKGISIFSIVAGFVIGLMLCTVLEAQTNPKIDNKIKFPITHWIMMGLNEKYDGRWNSKDFNYTYNSGEHKFENNIKKIGKTVNELNLGGVINIICQKTRVVWSNGGYGYLLNRLEDVENINDFYEYICGNGKIFFLYYCQICKVAMLVLLLIALFEEIKNKNRLNSKYNFIYISILGAFVFYFFWEAQLRYSLTFLPWMILIFGTGLENLEKFLSKIRFYIKLKNNQININNCTIRKICLCFIIILTLYVFLNNYKKYVVEEKEYVDTIVVQRDSMDNNNLIKRIGNNNIKQTFKAFNSFNNIEIKFKKTNENRDLTYIFILKDIGGNILSYQSFSSNDIKDKEYYSFMFNEIIPKEDNNEYVIEIFPESYIEDKDKTIRYRSIF